VTENPVVMVDNQSILREINRWVDEGGRTFLTLSVNPDILRMVIGRLSMRIDQGTSTILCKIKSHRSVEMYTCSNTSLGRKRKNRWFCFFIFKPPPLFFYYNFSSKHVCLTIRIERCSPVRSHSLRIYVFSGVSL
jgi:hypothetical protein